MADYTMGLAVYEERFFSRDWFDFTLQHAEPGVSILRKVRALKARNELPASTLDWLTLLDAIGGPRFGFSGLAMAMRAGATLLTGAQIDIPGKPLERRASDAVERAKPILSHADVLRAVDSADVDGDPSARLRGSAEEALGAYFAHLVELAAGFIEQ